MKRAIRIWGRSNETCKVVKVRVWFDEQGKLLNPVALARSKMVGWGDWQTSKKLACDHGWLWYCTTAGHGGYILVTQTRYDKFGSPALFWESEDQRLKFFVYEFEEDCRWAVIEYLDEKVLEASVAYLKQRGYDKELTKERWLKNEVIPTMVHWNPESLRDEDRHLIPLKEPAGSIG